MKTFGTKKLITLVLSLIFIFMLALVPAAADSEDIPLPEDTVAAEAVDDTSKESEIIIEIVEIVPEEVPLAEIYENPVTGSRSWSVINIVLSVLTLMAACMMLGGADKFCNASNIIRAASIIPAFASVAAVIFSSNFAGTVSFANGATILIVGLAALQGAIVALALNSAEKAAER